MITAKELIEAKKLYDDMREHFRPSIAKEIMVHVECDKLRNFDGSKREWAEGYQAATNTVKDRLSAMIASDSASE